MEAPQQRRRRPAATYGKSVKKRYSDFGAGDTFPSTTSSPKQREEEQRTTSMGATKTIRSSILVTATTVTAKARNNQNQTTKLPPLSDGGEADLLAKPVEKRPQTMLNGNNKRSSPASAVTSPPKHLKVFDFDSGSDDIIQPRKTASNPKGNDGFDVPSSDEEEPVTVKKRTLPRPLSGIPSTSVTVRRFVKGVKPGVADLSTHDNGPPRNNLPPKKQGKQISNKSTTASRIVKFPSSSKVPKPSKVPKAPNTTPPKPEQAYNPDMSLFTIEIDGPVPQGSRVTRSQSKQPEVEPEVLGEQQPDQKASRAKLTQIKPQMDSSNGFAGASKPTVTKRATGVVSAPLPVVRGELPCPPLFQPSPQATRLNPNPYLPGISSHVNELPKKDKQLSAEFRGPGRIRGNVPRVSEIFLNGAEESAPRRRRLIDRLGAGASQSDLMESNNDESEEEYSQSQSRSQPVSQSRNIFDSQVVDTATEGQPQEFITEPLAKLVYSGGRVGPKITYARQRSFRTEELDENALFNTPLIMAQQQRNTGLGEGEELEGDTGSKMMKTIHELREAGTNNRFLDDVEELFGDIEGGTPLGRQRSGYLELASKMRDKAFIGKFRANNFTERLLTSLDRQTDEVICFSLSFILCCLLLEDTTVQTVSQVRGNGSLPMLVRMLDFEKDIYITAKDRKTNMSKAAQGLVQDLRTRVEKSPAFAERKLKVFSGQIMALKVLEESVRKLREAGASDDFLPAGGLKKLVQIMKPFSELKNTMKAPGTLPLELTVSILESYTIGSRVLPELQFSADELKVVANLLPAVVEIGAKDMKDILLLILRFDINLTNGRSSICDRFAESSPSLIPKLVYMIRDKFNDLAGLDLGMEERLVQLDLLVLSLGLLINFAELSDKARYAVVGQDTILLDMLLRIFLERLEWTAEADSVEESHTNVAFGYLSILLGNLCQNPRIGDEIRQKMPKTTLTPLISSLEEFIAHHRRVDDQYEGNGEGPNEAFTERLEQVVKKLKEGR